MSGKKMGIAPGGCVRAPKDILGRQLRNSLRGTKYVCAECGVNPVEKKGQLCLMCIERDEGEIRDPQEEYLEEHLCVICKKNLVEYKDDPCIDCGEKADATEDGFPHDKS
ncbi:MAG: hypothetical protein HYT93_04780 [Parcubacteria group bacterium]|nr:hypothetical protein [Parcubacteria group bacterium]